MSKKISMFKVTTEIKRIITAVPIEIEDEDLITINDAAKLRGVTIPSITSMMDSGTLPTYQFADVDVPNVKPQRLTSRKAVLALGKAVRGNKRGILKSGYISPRNLKFVESSMLSV